MDVSLTLIGIFNIECAVLPSSNSRAAIPEDAKASAIWPCERIYANKVLYTNVLPDPPQPWTKNNFDLIEFSFALMSILLNALI